jgi:hypothetical protein
VSFRVEIQSPSRLAECVRNWRAVSRHCAFSVLRCRNDLLPRNTAPGCAIIREGKPPRLRAESGHGVERLWECDRGPNTRQIQCRVLRFRLTNRTSAVVRGSPPFALTSEGFPRPAGDASRDARTLQSRPQDLALQDAQQQLEVQSPHRRAPPSLKKRNPRPCI